MLLPRANGFVGLLIICGQGKLYVAFHANLNSILTAAIVYASVLLRDPLVSSQCLRILADVMAAFVTSWDAVSDAPDFVRSEARVRMVICRPVIGRGYRIDAVVTGPRSCLGTKGSRPRLIPGFDKVTVSGDCSLLLVCDSRGLMRRKMLLTYHIRDVFSGCGSMVLSISALPGTLWEVVAWLRDYMVKVRKSRQACLMLHPSPLVESPRVAFGSNVWLRFLMGTDGLSRLCGVEEFSTPPHCPEGPRGRGRLSLMMDCTSHCQPGRSYLNICFSPRLGRWIAKQYLPGRCSDVIKGMHQQPIPVEGHRLKLNVRVVNARLRWLDSMSSNEVSGWPRGLMKKHSCRSIFCGPGRSRMMMMQ
ncbi:hypothetical protein Nepgr_033946 [Nepenthes gracilis]|uniref:Uncharacterized protein n=1 Tax=Nepenthes gracilis TaxID=150966 RepID=A0AAD3TN65_NEPGR|nr:hypothetical protein Nepgr_033946 [Nepenthes gracilis]